MQLKRHYNLHQRQLAVYKQIEQNHFHSLDKLDLPGKCQYLTLRQGIRYEKEYIGWCEEAIEVLQEEVG